MDIRYDISRVRKLVATGDDIKILDDVKQVLLPLLPLPIETVSKAGQPVLELLPKLLSQIGVPEKAVEIVVNAFLEQRSIIETLHTYRIENEDKIN